MSRMGRAARLEDMMGSFSIWHWLVVLLVVLLLFGSGKVSNLMGDFAKGIKAFKKNMAEDDSASMEASAEKPTGTLPGPGPGGGTSTGDTQPKAAAHQG
jgi:sec-independent protein translocase protein TatA